MSNLKIMVCAFLVLKIHPISFPGQKLHKSIGIEPSNLSSEEVLRKTKQDIAQLKKQHLDVEQCIKKKKVKFQYNLHYNSSKSVI